VSRAGTAALTALARAAGARVVVAVEAFKITERLSAGDDASFECADALSFPVAVIPPVPAAGSSAIEALSAIVWDETSAPGAPLPLPAPNGWIAPLSDITLPKYIDAFLTDVTPALLHPAALVPLTRLEKRGDDEWSAEGSSDGEDSDSEE
jgi:translation initiation factor 2B subunit (eIF-2B alpha/beta/delta family)